MSQNQSYFWQTSRHNVYLKRSAKLQMFLALLAVLTFATVCAAEVAPKLADETAPGVAQQTNSDVDEAIFAKDERFDVANNLPNADATKEPKGNAGFLDAFTASISVILFTELGDKTFFIAAIMAMRHPRLVVFTGAITALALMTVLSVVFGMAATIIPKVYTYYISTALFAIFGLKMIYEGYFMKATDAQEELEEVQSDLRKREDELFRSKRGGDSETKRKNSNSDKEDADLEESGAGAPIATPPALATAQNPEMQHRQRKQLSSAHNNNLNNNGCELKDKDGVAAAVLSDSSANNDSDEFLTGEEALKMSTFHSSPALSASALSNQTNQTNCDDDDTSINHKLRYNSSKTNNNNNNIVIIGSNDGTPTATPTKKSATNDCNGRVLVHSASAMANFNKQQSSNNKQVNGKILNTTGASVNSVDSITSLGLNSANGVAAGQSNGELKQVGGSKKRLERDVTSTLIQDPESGVVRKNAKRGAAYLTTRILMQAFTMTFLAEWGDRSQLTTIILAASKNAYGVTAGGVIGHSICTGLAVVGGRMVAAKISVRTVTIVGGIVFLGFAIYALIVRPDDI